jgi:hypothetical protein
LPSFLDTTIFIVLAYFGAACVGVLAAASAWRRDRRREAIAWACIVLMLFGIALVRELDLLRYPGREVREFAVDGGWYDHRRPLQRLAIRGIVLGSIITAIAGIILLRAERTMIVVGFVATTYVVGLLAVRAVSLHGVDMFMLDSLVGLTRARGMELPGLAIVAAAAAVAAFPASGERSTA